MKWCLLFILVVIAVSCRSSTELLQEIQTIDIVTNHIEEEVDLLDYFDVKFIPLETSVKSTIRRIDKIVLVDSNILVADERANKLFLFDSKGLFIKAMNPVGKPGPGEFNMVRDIDYHNDTVYLNDFRRILKYDKTLKWLETRSLDKPIDGIAIFDNYAYCFANNQFMDPARIIKYDPGFSSSPRIIMNEYRKMGRFRMRQSLNMLKFENHALLSIFHMDTIYSIGSDGILPKYRINFLDKEFATHYFDKVPANYDSGLFMDNLNKTKLAHNIYDFVDHHDIFFFIFILDGKGVYSIKFKDSGNLVLSHNLLLDGIDIGIRLKGFFNGRAFFCIEPHEISPRLKTQYPEFQNGFDEFSNPVIMELSLRHE